MRFLLLYMDFLSVRQDIIYNSLRFTPEYAYIGPTEK